MAPSWQRVIAHADMDAFYAAVEQLDRPELRGKPILVGPRSGRGVVLTASYEARPYGVGSAMPMARALRRCPDALVIPPRFDRYTEVSSAIMKVFEQFSPQVEAISLDEAFIDLTGSERVLGAPEEVGPRIKSAVREATGGLTISVGIAATKYVAKVASAHGKPDGLTIVPPGEARAWLAPQAVSRLWGAGPKTQARLQALGYETIGDVGAAPLALLENQLGRMGARFHRLAHAEDPRDVEGRRAHRSMGSDRTLSADISKREDILMHLRRSAHRIARRLRAKSWYAGGIRVRLKTVDFKLLTRQCALPERTDVAEALFATAIRLLDRFDHQGPFRLVGLAAFDLGPTSAPQQLNLLEVAPEHRRLEVGIDQLSERFGDGVVVRAKDLGRGTVIDATPNLDAVYDEMVADGEAPERGEPDA